MTPARTEICPYVGVTAYTTFVVSCSNTVRKRTSMFDVVLADVATHQHLLIGGVDRGPDHERVPTGRLCVGTVEVNVIVVAPAVEAVWTVPSSVPTEYVEIAYSDCVTFVSWTGLLPGRIGSPVFTVTSACPTYTVFCPLLCSRTLFAALVFGVNSHVGV